MTGLANQVAVGSVWMVLLRLSDRLIGLASILILARLLHPDDFGLVALVAAMSAMLEVFTDLGVEAALIRDQSAMSASYNTAWTLMVAKGFLVAAALCLMAAPIASLFSEQRMEPILYWLAIRSVVGGVQNIGVVDFRKHLKFRRDFLFVFWPRLISMIVTVVAAFALRNYWALVMGIVVRAVMSTLLSYKMSDYRPQFAISEFRELFRFSKWMIPNGILSAMLERANQLVLGKMVNAEAVGLFSVSYQISNLATSEMTSPIRRAIYPAYAKIASDAGRLRSGFLSVFGVTLLIALPIAVGIALTADLVVPILLGKNWTDAIPIIEVLALVGIVNVCTTGSYPVYLALNKPHLSTVVLFVKTILIVSAFTWGVSESGVEGGAWCMLAATVLSAIFDYVLVLRAIRLEIKKLISLVWRPLLAATALWYCVDRVRHFAESQYSNVSDILLLALCVVVGGAAYCVSIFASWLIARPRQSPEERLFEVVRNWMTKTSKGTHWSEQES